MLVKINTKITQNRHPRVQNHKVAVRSRAFSMFEYRTGKSYSRTLPGKVNSRLCSPDGSRGILEKFIKSANGGYDNYHRVARPFGGVWGKFHLTLRRCEREGFPFWTRTRQDYAVWNRLLAQTSKATYHSWKYPPLYFPIKTAPLCPWRARWKALMGGSAKITSKISPLLFRARFSSCPPLPTLDTGNAFYCTNRTYTETHTRTQVRACVHWIALFHFVHGVRSVGNGISLIFIV